MSEVGRTKRGHGGSTSVVLSVLIVMSALVLTVPETSSPVAGIQFSRPNIKVDHSPVTPFNPSIAVDDQGSLHAVWEDNRSGYSGIYYSKSTDSGLTWSPEILISINTPGHYHFSPRIAADTTSPAYTGSIYVVYEKLLDGFAVWISYSRDRGATWDDVQVDHAGVLVRSEQPAVGVVENGTVYVAWKDGRDPIYQIYVSASYDGGVTWTSERRVSTTDQWNVRPSIATWGSSVYIAWQEFHDTYYASVWCAHSSDGMNWDVAGRIAEMGTFRVMKLDPDVAVDASGGILLIWSVQEQDLDWIIEFSRSDDNGQTWTSPVRVDHGGYSVKDIRSPKVSVGGGNIYVVWSYEVLSDRGVYFTYSPDGGVTWEGEGIQSQDIPVDDTRGNGDPNDDWTEQTNPSITSTDYGVYVVWQDKRSQVKWEIYFAKTAISQLQLTEIRDSPTGLEAIEIHNYGSESQDMSGKNLWIEGQPKIDLSGLGLIPAGGYRTIGDSASNDLVMDITLGDEGGLLALLDGMKAIDLVGYGQSGTAPDPLTGESVSRHWNGERYTFDWVRESSPTFGFQNNVPNVEKNPTLVLNEVLFNPLSPSDRFVEVMLLGAESLNIGGYSVVCDSPHVISSVTLTVDNPTYAILQSNAPALFSTMTASADNVYLYDPTGRLLDMVGWSSPHTQGLSVARVPEGNGTYDGYDDASSIQAGWDFDTSPTPSVVSIGPNQWKSGDPGEKVSYVLIVANQGSGADYIDITYVSSPNGWEVGLYHENGVVPLTDSPGDGDGIPDIGSLASFATRKIVVKVTIPPAPQTGTYENTTVRATSSTNPSLHGSALLVTRPYPSISVDKRISPQGIYIETAGPEYEKEAAITLNVNGTGSSVFFDIPQDVIFLVDMSNSIGHVNFTLEKNLVLTYLRQMRKPDRAAVVFFEGVPIFKRPLSGNYDEVEADVRSEPTVSAEIEPPHDTSIGIALEEVVDYLIQFGQRNHSRIVFLLTDGFNAWWALEPPYNHPHPLDVAAWASAHNVSIHPFGIRGSSGGPDAWVLEEIARITGTSYVFVNSSHVMDGMRDEIGLIERSTAVYDADPDDTISLVQDVLPSYVHYVPGSSVNPETGVAREPSIIQRNGLTYLMWNEVRIHVEDQWAVSFRITCGLIGQHLANVYDEPTDTRVMGLSWNGTRVILPFPQVYVNCLPEAQSLLEPDGVSSRLEGTSFRDVNVTWNLSPSDPGEVDRYDVYISSEFHLDGFGYVLLGSSPAGKGYYVAMNLGEGNPSDFFFQVCAVNLMGQRACADDQAGKFTRSLAPGPNLVSIPLVQLDESIETVLQTVEYDKAWYYDSSSQEWKWFMASKTYRRGLWNVNHTMGLWVNVTMHSNLTVAGSVPSQTTIYLHEGWNLVSFPSFNRTYTVSCLNALVGSTRVEGSRPMPVYHLFVLEDLDTLQTGDGYWVRVALDVPWIVDIV